MILKLRLTLIPTLKLSIFLLGLITLSINAQEPVIASYYSAKGEPTAVSNLPAEKLSHILYAFVGLCGDNSGTNAATQKAMATACEGKAPFSAVFYNENAVMTELNAFRKLKQQHPHLRILPSFGGWTLSQPFHEMAKSNSGLKHFVESALELIKKHEVFDGIDIDWEYPGGGGNNQRKLQGKAALNEKLVFTLMMKELREGLNKLQQQTGREYQLSAAVSGQADKTNAIDWKKTIPFMDYVFAMTYDFAVGNGRASHHTNLFSSENNPQSSEAMINNLLNAGIPEQKLVLGIAFYGRGWTNSGWQGDHFNKENQAVSIGSFTYKALINKPPTGYQYGYDTKAQAAYFYNADNKGFISFDDKRSTLAKAQWAKNKGLAGVFSWQLIQDNGNLLDAMNKGMKLKAKE
ncbi:glycoside hydrolase family 18 protein [Thalassotalea profundi]|uniref:chitinase n=1 Tax=Thalassotalea profundi TaxID=2036687 RepID=A0ABQ3J2J7_9GAMM|nr:glycoside hydrolase family 18 protein [Thalassotalea profundi]GHF01472.1 chitinase [Thalassotalea profundi]